VNYDIFRLDIPVDDSKRMYFIDCITDLLDDRRYFRLLHWLCSLQLMEKLTSSAYFKNDVNMRFIIKGTVHLYNVWMIEIKLNFKLSYKLLCNFLLFYQLLFNHLQRADKACVSLPYIKYTY
jgi:hypothetical protein